MENRIEREPNHCMDFSVEEDKPFFGVYLNQARLNAYITLCEISERVGEPIVEEDSLHVMPVLNLLDNGKDLIKQQRVYDMIEEHFPMLKGIYSSLEKQNQEERKLEERASDYKKILRCLLNALSKKRNEYCHLYSGESKLDSGDIKELCWHLDSCFKASVDEIKKVRGFDERDVLHLRKKTRIKGKLGDNPNFFCKFIDAKGELTQKGLAFLTTLFLEKQDSFLFLKKQSGFKRGERPSEKATLESFCAYKIRIPKPVIKSDNDENGLALDMLNELGKCPKELFDIIDKDKQEDFRREDEDGNDVLMRRYSDRFGYFALKYCDDTEKFKNLRFHIDLGKYYFKFYDKDTIDGEQYKRSLDRRLRTFGRLKEVREQVKSQWGDLIKSPNEINSEQNEPFKADNTPHYHIVDNNIGLRITRNVELNELDSKAKYKLRQPKGWLSVYELPAMVFYGMKCEGGFDEVERMLTDYIKEHSGASGDKAECSDDECISYRLRKLERFIVDSQKRKKALESSLERGDDKGNKPGKKMFVDIKAGELADFLARDMIAMQAFDPEKNGKDKITSLNFQVLQSSIAFYGRNRDSLDNMFRRAGFIGSVNPHPFIDKVKPREHSSIISFYRAYLDEKINFLESCRASGDLSHQCLRPTRPSNSGRKASDDVTPVNIPRGFFSKRIEELVCKKIPTLKGREMNSAYMMAQYFDMEDSSQEFYDYERTYPIVKKAENYRKINNRNRDLIPYFEAGTDYATAKKLIKDIPDEAVFNPPTLKENLLKACGRMKDNERVLRRYKVQDMAMMMMVENILKSELVGEGDLDIKLKDIGIEKGSAFKNPINCKIDFDVPFRTAEKNHDAVYVEFIKDNLKERYKLQDKKIIVGYSMKSKEAKLKDIGKYRRYLHDRRLPGLLLWKKMPEIETDEIKKELDAYEQHRFEIAAKLAVLEKMALEGREQTEEHVSFNEVIGIIKGNLPAFSDKCDILLSIRNSVYHNQYPVYCEQIDCRGGGTIAEKMLDIVGEMSVISYQ